MAEEQKNLEESLVQGEQTVVMIEGSSFRVNSTGEEMVESGPVDNDGGNGEESTGDEDIA